MTDALIDAHTHAWGADGDPYPWQASVLPPGWDGAYPTDQLLADMDAVGVDEAVIVTTPLYGRQPGANAYTVDAVRAHPDRLYGVGVLEYFPEESPTVGARLRDVVAPDGMLGVRLHAALAYEAIPTAVDRTGDWFLDERLAPAFEAAAETDAAMFVFPKAQQLGDVATLVDRYPDVQFVIDHMAWPDATTAPDAPPWTRMQALADRANVAVKVSSLPRSSDEDWPYADLWPYVKQLVEWFGPDRLMLGSDYPWMDDWASYESCLSWLAEPPFLSARDRRYLRADSFRAVHDPN